MLEEPCVHTFNMLEIIVQTLLVQLGSLNAMKIMGPQGCRAKGNMSLPQKR